MVAAPEEKYRPRAAEEAGAPALAPRDYVSGTTAGGWPEPITGIPFNGQQDRQAGLWPEPITGITGTAQPLRANGAGPQASAAALPSPKELAAEELVKVREVGLQRGEEVTHIFRPAEGLAAELPALGPALVLTNERIIAFCQSDSSRDTYLVPTSEMKHAVVKAGTRNLATLFQGVLMAVAGLLAYVVVGYWLASHLDGPSIPVLNMDLGPLIALVIVLAGLGLIAQVYFTRPDGTVTFQGDGLQFSFPFRGKAAGAQVYDVVNAAFASRQQGALESQPEEVQVEPAPELPERDALHQPTGLAEQALPERDALHQTPKLAAAELAMPAGVEPTDEKDEARGVSSA